MDISVIIKDISRVNDVVRVKSFLESEVNERCKYEILYESCKQRNRKVFDFCLELIDLKVVDANRLFLSASHDTDWLLYLIDIFSINNMGAIVSLPDDVFKNDKEGFRKVYQRLSSIYDFPGEKLQNFNFYNGGWKVPLPPFFGDKDYYKKALLLSILGVNVSVTKEILEYGENKNFFKNLIGDNLYMDSACGKPNKEMLELLLSYGFTFGHDTIGNLVRDIYQDCFELFKDTIFEKDNNELREKLINTCIVNNSPEILKYILTNCDLMQRPDLTFCGKMALRYRHIELLRILKVYSFNSFYEVIITEYDENEDFDMEDFY